MQKPVIQRIKRRAGCCQLLPVTCGHRGNDTGNGLVTVVSLRSAVICFPENGKSPHSKPVTFLLLPAAKCRSGMFFTPQPPHRAAPQPPHRAAPQDRTPPHRRTTPAAPQDRTCRTAMPAPPHAGPHPFHARSHPSHTGAAPAPRKTAPAPHKTTLVPRKTTPVPRAGPHPVVAIHRPAVSAGRMPVPTSECRIFRGSGCINRFFLYLAGKTNPPYY